MTTRKSIIEVDVKDSSFKKFAAAFAAYTSALTGAVKDTESLNTANTKTAAAGAKQAKQETEAIVGKRKARKAAATEAAADAKKADEQRKKETAAQKKQFDIERKAQAQKKKDSADQVKQFKDMAKWTGDVAWSLGKGAVSLAKWAALGAIGGGFGLGGIASSASDARRTSQGFGINSGELRAARVNFGAYVDPEAALGNIANAQSDVSKRWIFDAIGERTEGKNAAEILPEILPKLVAAFRAGGSTTQGADARGLTQLVGIEDLRRLSAITSDELSKTIEAYRHDRESLSVDDSTNRDWQQFLISIHRAGQEIEKALIEGLQPLLPSLREFSHGMSEAIKAFLSSPQLRQWIGDLGKGIQRLGAYLGSNEFQDDMDKFLVGIHKIAAFLGKYFGETEEEKSRRINTAAAKSIQGYADDDEREADEALARYHAGGSSSSEPGVKNHNPGNLRIPGSATGFQSFANDDDGIRAVANQLRLYQDDKHGHLDTISKILSVYSPSNENNTAALIKAASSRTGFGADQHLDLSNNDQLVKLISAILKQENGHSNYTPAGIRVAIHDATGGNVATSVAALGAR